jgi:hypothetical protein
MFLLKTKGQHHASDGAAAPSLMDVSYQWNNGSLKRHLSYPCPYCGDDDTFFLELKIWLISHRVFLCEVERSCAETAEG